MLIQLCKVCMTALTVDLQDLGCHVGVGQSHMLHATGVGDAIVPSVHLELEAAPHCEWFSRCIHLRSACSESENEQGPNVHVNYYITGEQIWILCEPFMQKKSFLEKQQRKTEISSMLPNTWETWNFIARCCFVDIDRYSVVVFLCIPFEGKNPWPLKVKSK